MVTAAVGDELFGPTSDRGNSERRQRRQRCDMLQMGWLSLLISSGIRTNYYRSGNRFHFVAIYRIFCFRCWEFKNGSRVVVFLSGESLYFPCQFEYLVQYLLVHGCDFLLPTAIMLRVGLIFVVFC